MAPPIGRPEERQDPGFGRVVAQQNRQRFLNRDGTANSRKFGMSGGRGQRLYMRALALSWPRFALWSAAALLLVAGVFALAFRALGPGALAGGDALGLDDAFLRAFFYSVAVLLTAGLGDMHPVGVAAHWLVVAESLAGVLALVGIAGLAVARLTRPRVTIRFSSSALVAPYGEGRGLMFRCVNTSPSELVDVQATFMLSWFEPEGTQRVRRFHVLPLERDGVEFFTLHWTVVHPLDAGSPMRGVTPELLREREAELLVHLTGLDELFSTRISARTSYRFDEVRWDGRFADMFVSVPDGIMTVDLDRLDRIERLPEGTTAVARE